MRAKVTKSVKGCIKMGGLVTVVRLPPTGLVDFLINSILFMRLVDRANEKIHNLLAPETDVMLEDYEKKKKKDISLMRAIRDYGIGVVITLFGVFMFFRDQFNLALNERYKPDVMDKVLGVMCVAYGIWRLYRGYRRNYFK